ncbi:MAG: gamma-glutamyl-gamma-aminobutyrate hydrolase family protein [Gemmatimonadaceae bacterium]
MPSPTAADRPLVAVTATTEMSADLLRVRVNDSYIRSLEQAGLTPLVIPPLTDLAAAEVALRPFHGLVLTGGEDVEPAFYGAQRHPACKPGNSIRDAWERALVSEARVRLLPALAICRGAQILNVALGGTLVQDIPSQCTGAPDHDPGGGRFGRVHEVAIVAGSALADALGTTAMRVNSVHHQALDRVAAPLRVTAQAPDGIIEGVEMDGTAGDGWWAVGVQWHPEDLTGPGGECERALFAAFARQARAFAAGLGRGVRSRRVHPN